MSGRSSLTVGFGQVICIPKHRRVDTLSCNLDIAEVEDIITGQVEMLFPSASLLHEHELRVDLRLDFVFPQGTSNLFWLPEQIHSYMFHVLRFRLGRPP